MNARHTAAVALAACAVSMAVTAPAHSQQLYQQGACVFAGPPAADQKNLQGCYVRLNNGRVVYAHVGGSVLDMQTNTWIRASSSGPIIYSTRRMWEPVQNVRGGPELLAQLRAGLPQRQQQPSTGTTITFGTPWEYAQLLNNSQVTATPAPQGGMILSIPPMPAYGPGGGFPGASAGASSAGGSWVQPDCRNLPGRPCPGVYDPTPHIDRGTPRDRNPNTRR